MKKAICNFFQTFNKALRNHFSANNLMSSDAELLLLVPFKDCIFLVILQKLTFFTIRLKIECRDIPDKSIQKHTRRIKEF